MEIRYSGDDYDLALKDNAISIQKKLILNGVLSSSLTIKKDIHVDSKKTVSSIAPSDKEDSIIVSYSDNTSTCFPFNLQSIFNCNQLLSEQQHVNINLQYAQDANRILTCKKQHGLQISADKNQVTVKGYGQEKELLAKEKDIKGIFYKGGLIVVFDDGTVQIFKNAYFSHLSNQLKDGECSLEINLQEVANTFMNNIVALSANQFADNEDGLEEMENIMRHIYSYIISETYSSIHHAKKPEKKAEIRNQAIETFQELNKMVENGIWGDPISFQSPNHTKDRLFFAITLLAGITLLAAGIAALVMAPTTLNVFAWIPPVIYKAFEIIGSLLLVLSVAPLALGITMAVKKTSNDSKFSKNIEQFRNWCGGEASDDGTDNLEIFTDGCSLGQTGEFQS